MPLMISIAPFWLPSESKLERVIRVSPSIYGLSRAIEDSAQLVPRHRSLEDLRKQHIRLAKARANYACSARKYGLTSPVNSSEVPWLSMPEVPSKTCTTALLPSTSSTCPLR